MSEDQVLTGLSRLKRELAQLKSHLQEIEEYVERLEAEAPVQETAASIPAPSPLALGGVAEFASRAEQASDQEGILVALLESAGGLCENALLLVENEAGGYSPWNSRGFDSDDWQNVLIGREDPVAQGAKEQRILTFDRDGGDLPNSLKSLGGAGNAASVPLMFGDRVPVILLAASTAELDLDSLRLLVELARLYIQNQFLGTLEGSDLTTASISSRWPTLEPLASAPAQTGDQPPDSEPTGLEIESELAEEADLSMKVETVSAEEVSTPEPAEATETEAGLAWESDIETPAPPPTPEVESQTREAEASPERAYELDDFPEVKPEELGMSDEEFSRLMGKASSDWKSSSEEIAETGPTQDREPSGPEPDSEPVEEGDEKQDAAEAAELHAHTPVQEEEVMHAEARRFARLLVAEIKLYNEDEVQEGRVSSDLYRRLKADIDRSREMYEKRVTPPVRESEDYFHAEMVRVLAQDDPALMGSDYPGPQVGSTP